jgi:hypothetical protein
MPEPKPMWTLLGRVFVWAGTRKQPAPQGFTLMSGDFRDWPAIRAWAREIATELPEARHRAVA